MIRPELLALHAELTARARSLMDRKNQDYAHQDEVFGNLNMIEALGLGSCEMGIVIRMSDKLRRLAGLTKQDAACKDETVTDTILDIINYAVLFEARRVSRATDDLKAAAAEVIDATFGHSSESH